MNLTGVLSAFLLALSLCADCFAVTSCSSITISGINWRKVGPVALAFGIIQTLLMLLGWMFGDLFVGIIEKMAGIIGFLMLLYVGASMILEAVKDEESPRNLNGIRNVIIAGIATSIDAFAVGIGMSMDHTSRDGGVLDLSAVFIVTIISVIAGMFGGGRIGDKFGRPAEIAGGIVLILIGLSILVF